MRLLITDEHVTFREFLKSFLSSIPKFQVAGETSDGLEAVELDAWLKPDLASVDVRCHGWTDLIWGSLLSRNHKAAPRLSGQGCTGMGNTRCRSARISGPKATEQHLTAQKTVCKTSIRLVLRF